MVFSSWFRTLKSRLEVPRTGRRNHRPRLEELEDRTTPSSFQVTPLAADGAPNSLRAAVIAAASTPGPDVIFMDAGTYYLTEDKLWISGGDVRLQAAGNGSVSIAIDPSVDSGILAVLDSANNVVIDGVTLTGSRYGPAIANLATLGGTLTVKNSTLSGNHAGAIFNIGTLTVINSTLSGNSAGFNSGGGAIRSQGTVTIIDSTLSGNSANTSGGAIASSGSLTVMNSTLSGNSAGIDGGAIIADGTMTIDSSTLSGNSAVYHGGGIFNAGELSIISSSVCGNSATVGADLYNFASPNTSSNGTVTIIASSVCDIYNDGGTIRVPEVEINNLISQIAGLNLTSAQRDSLTSKLQAAQQSLANANTTAAANQLNAFVNQVNALVHSHRLGEITADLLIDDLQSLINAIT